MSIQAGEVPAVANYGLSYPKRVNMSTTQYQLSPSLSPEISHDLVQAVRNYVEAHEPHLPITYKWSPKASELRALLGLSLTGSNGFAQNLDLKRQLSNVWKTQPSSRRTVSDYYVRVWGGIKRNAPEKIDTYTVAVAAGTSLPFSGVASWSKIATAADPEKAAIFDARVSVSLNALQILTQQKVGVLFPVLASQNRLMKAANPLFKSGAKKRGWVSLPVDETYEAYMSLLAHASVGLNGPLRIARAEMVLFANAVCLATAVLPVLS
jgi:hypothetical protein